MSSACLSDAENKERSDNCSRCFRLNPLSCFSFQFYSSAKHSTLDNMTETHRVAVLTVRIQTLSSLDIHSTNDDSLPKKALLDQRSKSRTYLVQYPAQMNF